MPRVGNAFLSHRNITVTVAQNKWYRLNYEKIFEDTEFDLLNEGASEGTSSESPQKSSHQLKPKQQANVHELV